MADQSATNVYVELGICILAVNSHYRLQALGTTNTSLRKLKPFLFTNVPWRSKLLTGTLQIRETCACIG